MTEGTCLPFDIPSERRQGRRPPISRTGRSRQTAGCIREWRGLEDLVVTAASDGAPRQARRSGVPCRSPLIPPYASRHLMESDLAGPELPGHRVPASCPQQVLPDPFRRHRPGCLKRDVPARAAVGLALAHPPETDLCPRDPARPRTRRAAPAPSARDPSLPRPERSAHHDRPWQSASRRFNPVMAGDRATRRMPSSMTQPAR